MKQLRITILLTVLMSMFGAKAFAYHNIAIANKDGVIIYYNWSFDHTALAVSGLGGNYSGDVVIPETVEYEGKTYKVTSIEDYAFDGSKLTSVTIPNSVTSIGGAAFRSSSLTSVTIPNSVTSIEEQAFFDCPNLTSVNIGSGVTSMGKLVFSGCENLTSVTIGNGVTSIGEQAFDGSKLTSVTIPNSVTSIGRSAFYHCRSLTSVTIPNSVTSIGSGAFHETAWYNNQPDGLVYAGKVAYKYKGEMSANKNITIKDGTLGIAEAAFSGCDRLTSVTIPNSVSTIGYNAFFDCSGLIFVTIPNSVTTIGYGAFSGTAWYNNQPDGLVYAGKVAYTYKGEMPANTSITLEDGTIGIAQSAFYKCSGLTSVTIPNSVTSIGNQAFAGCSSLTSVTISNSVTRIRPNTFYGCSGLTSVTIPNSVTSIGHGAFQRCSSLASVTIPNSVTSIDYEAFRECSSLASVTIPNGVTSIERFAFFDCPNLTSVTIPKSVIFIGRQAFQLCSGLTSIVVEDGNTVYDSRNNCNAIIAKSSNTLILGCQKTKIPNEVAFIGWCAFFGCSGLTSIDIPNSVTYISDAAFSGCTGLISLNFPNSVISIDNGALSETAWFNNQPDGLVYAGKVAYTYKGEMPANTNITLMDGTLAIANSAFSGRSGLASVTIPNSVTSIGHGAFQRCSSLASISIPNSVTSIGDYAFNSCGSLTSVTIPNSVTSIGYTAFAHCSGLTSVTIGNGMTSIGGYTFEGCSGLTSVTIGNGVTTIDRKAFDACNSLSRLEFHCDKVGKWFSGKESINEIITGKEVTTIDDGAFSGCKNLTSVVIGSGVSSIGKDAFSNTNLKKTIWLTNTPPTGASYAQGAINYVANEEYNIDNKVVYPFLSSYFDVDGIRYLPVSLSDKTCDAIDCVHDESVENLQIASTVVYKGISMSVKKIQPYIGYGNKYIKSLNLCNNGYLGNYAFSNCSNMETADISNTGAIGQYAFDKCSKLKNLKLGSSVSGIGSYSYRGCSSLESVTIPDLVETIGQYAFSGCSVLKEVKLGSSVKTIDQFAFSDCESLLSITIPQAVTDIKNAVFYNCKSLKEVIIEDSETELNLGSNYSRTSGTQFYENPLFSSCPLDNVYIGRNIIYGTDKNSGYSPFYGNATLRAVKIADKETEISENEFYGCTNLQKVVIGDGVTTIANRAFSSCSSLNVFTFGTQVATIGQEAFSDCTALSVIASKAQTPPTCGTQALDDINKWECKLYVPKDHKADYQAADQWKEFLFVEEGDYVITNEYTLTYMVDGVVYNTSKVAEGDAITPEPAPSKEGYTFSGWSEIPQTMPDHDVVVTGSFEIIDYSKPILIGDIYYNLDVQNKVAELTKSPKFYQQYSGDIIIPSKVTYNGTEFSVTSIGRVAFSDCKGLTSVTIPNSVTSIDEWAFEDCFYLVSVYITDIEAWYKISFGNPDSNPLAFAQHLYVNNEEFKDLVIPTGMTSIGDYAFYRFSGLTSLTIPNSVTSIGLSNFLECNGLTSIVVEDGNTVYDSRNNCNAIIEKSSNTLIAGCKNTTIPNSVTSIGEYAFRGCSGLTLVDIPNSVTSIGKCAFQYCEGLASVTIPNSVTSIGEGIFSWCTGLTSVTISNSVTSIGNGAFGGCIGLTSVTIPNSVTILGNGAFQNCRGLTSVIIGNSVTSIDYGAFSGCTALNEITCKADMPPTCGGSAFEGIDKSICKLYVPKGHLADYQTADQWKEFTNIEEKDFSDISTSVSISISSANQVTYMSDKNLDFTNKPELKAYVATGYDTVTGTIWLTRVKYVPANTGFLVMGDAGSYDIPIVSGGSTSYYMNLFKGTLEAATIYTTEGNCTNYYLSNGKFGVSFYKVTKEEGVTIGANRAYLQIPTEIPTVGVAGNTETINVTAAGQVPYYNSQSLDFSSLDALGVKAYTASGYDYTSGTIWLTRVKQVPAETGVLIMAPQGEYPVPTASVASVYANMFKGTLTGTTIQTHETIAGEDYINYYLSSGDAGVSFYKVTKEGGVQIGANRCYLPIKNKDAAAGTRSAGSGQNQIAFREADEVIGIPLFRGIGGDDDGTTNLTPALSEGEGEWYTLQGQRVDKPGKGLYIHNGKKVVIK